MQTPIQAFAWRRVCFFHPAKRKEWCRTQTPKTPKTPSNSTTSIRRRNSWVDVKNSSITPTFRSILSKALLAVSFPISWHTTRAKKVSESSQNGKRNKKNSRQPKTTIAASPFNNTNMAQRATNALWAISILWHKVAATWNKRSLWRLWLAISAPEYSRKQTVHIKSDLVFFFYFDSFHSSE